MKKNTEIMSRTQKYNQKKKKRKFLKLIILLLTITGLGFALYTSLNFFSNLNQGFKNSEKTESIDNNFKTFSILIMGVDENEERRAAGDSMRTDALIYMAVNKDKNRMDMVSIPRDSLSLMRMNADANQKNAYFFDKITHAYAYGGADATIESVSNLLNAPVNFYAKINFDAFEKVVDSLGGVRVYVPFDMLEQNAQGEQGTVELKQGWQLLNGEEALAFSRSRYYDSDIERGQRQLQVIHAIIDKAKSMNALTSINDLIKIGGDNVTHNMSMSQVFTAASMFVGGNMEIVSHRIGGYDAEMNGVYYYYPKPSHLFYVSSILNNTLGHPLPKSSDILNIHYQGYINPLDKRYRKTTEISPVGNLVPFEYILFSPEDVKINLPVTLTENDLLTSPTISDENKPSEN